MTDTPHKKTDLAPQILPPDSLALSHPSELLRPPHARSSRAQDTVLGGRRVLMSRHMGGSDEWLVDNTATGGGSQGKPDATTWRTAYESETELMAGSVTAIRGLAVPSGATEIMEGGPWILFGVGGATRVVTTWDNGTDTDTVTTQFELLGALDADGAEETDAGAAWSQVLHFVAPVSRPPDAANSLTEQAKWSEWPTLSFQVQDRGGARVIHMNVAEEPLEHVVADTVFETTCNGARPDLSWPNKIPQEEDADGATYDEHRFGIHRAMYAAARQTARVGPHIANWSSYAESLAGPADTTPTPKPITSATFVRLSAGSNTAWDADAVGYDITGTGRAPENLSTRVSGATSIPVRIRVKGQFNQAGANIATVRFQSSPRSWVELSFDQSVIGTTPTTVTTTGWLEAAVASDDNYVVLQDFVLTGGDTFEVTSWDVSYGDYAVA